ncbi:MAG: amidohydrolase family protein [Deltaproteobacteria bacterium]|nr:amidohydrolase family protein [Deltaproteobacteria bacterium]
MERGPVIDSHTLITPLDEPIDTALKLFKRVGVVKFCNKNGGFLGSRAFAATLRVKHRLKAQFEFFVNVSWDGVGQPGWGEHEAERLEREVGYGAKGIKFFKALGLGARDAQGALIPIDDPRFDPIMARAGKLNVVVAIHVGDPKAFFEPPTPQNERYDELKLAPDWSFYGADYPPLMELWKQAERLISRHPGTTFLFIHLGLSEDLDYMEKLLDAHPNVYLDTSARVPEFGRHPVDKAHSFFLKFQDRILFGTDLALGPDHWQLGSVSETPVGFEDAVKFYEAHFRYFETDLQNIDHPTPIQGRWKVNAIHLPAAVLRKLYYANAEALIFARKVTVPVVDPIGQPPPAAPPAPSQTR